MKISSFSQSGPQGPLQNIHACASHMLSPPEVYLGKLLVLATKQVSFPFLGVYFALKYI